MTKCQKKMNWGFFVTLQIYFRKIILRAKRAKFCLILFNFENWNWIWIFAPKKSITIWPTLGQKFTFYPKIHILKIPIFTKFTSLKSHFSQSTFLKSHFPQNSHIWNLIFHKIHLSGISIFTKFPLLSFKILTFIVYDLRVNVNFLKP